MFADLRSLEDAVRQPNLHRELKRDRLALLNVTSLLDTSRCVGRAEDGENWSESERKWQDEGEGGNVDV